MLHLAHCEEDGEAILEALSQHDREGRCLLGTYYAKGERPDVPTHKLESLLRRVDTARSQCCDDLSDRIQKWQDYEKGLEKKKTRSPVVQEKTSELTKARDSAKVEAASLHRTIKAGPTGNAAELERKVEAYEQMCRALMRTQEAA